MSEALEHAHHIQGHHNHAEGHSDRIARRIAVLVAVLAAMLAIAQMATNAASNAYLTHHIAVSDGWAFYQAKNLRSVVRSTEAMVLQSLPNATDPAVQARIKEARAYAARMQDEPNGDGMKQLAERARREEAAREVAFHKFHAYELVVGGLEIAIVLASVSVVTRINTLAIAAGVIGLLAAVGGSAVAAGLV